MEGIGLDQIFASVDKVINTTAATADSAPDSKERTILEAVLSRLRAIRAEAPEVLPVHLANLKARTEAIRDEAARLGPEFDTARARLDEVKAAAGRASEQALATLGAELPEPPAVPLPPSTWNSGRSCGRNS